MLDKVAIALCYLLDVCRAVLISITHLHEGLRGSASVENERDGASRANKFCAGQHNQMSKLQAGASISDRIHVM